MGTNRSLPSFNNSNNVIEIHDEDAVNTADINLSYQINGTIPLDNVSPYYISNSVGSTPATAIRLEDEGSSNHLHFIPYPTFQTPMD